MELANKNKLFYKIISRPVGLEPTALGFGNLRSTN